MLPEYKAAWITAFNGEKTKLIISFMVLGFTLIFFTGFLDWIEARPGVVINDPLLSLFNPIDLSIPIFISMYSALVIAVVVIAKMPDVFLTVVRAYIILMWCRVLFIICLPLAAPETTIILVDPIVGSSQDKPFTKDLFFSGHSSASFLLYFAIKHTIWKRIILTLTLFTSVALIVQHVHYTVDVLVAPFMAWGALTLAGKIQLKQTRGFI